MKTAPSKNGGLSYIEATREDIATADRLMEELMRRSLDELPSQTRRLLGLVDAMVSGECQRLKVERSDFRFSRRDVRAHTGWGHTQLKIHLHRLEELEYLIVHRGGRGQTFVYELNWSGPEEEKSGASRPQAGGMSATGRPTETRMNTGVNGVFHPRDGKTHMLRGPEMSRIVRKRKAPPAPANAAPVATGETSRRSASEATTPNTP